MRRAALLAILVLGAGCATTEIVSNSVQLHRVGDAQVAEVTPHAEFGEVLRVLQLMARSGAKRATLRVEGGGPAVEVTLAWPKAARPGAGLVVSAGQLAVLAAPLPELKKGRTGHFTSNKGIADADAATPELKALLAAAPRPTALVIEAPPETEAAAAIDAASKLAPLGFADGIFFNGW